MATAQPISAAAQPPRGPLPAAATAGPRDAQALVPVPPAQPDEGEELLQGPVARLPVELDVVVPVPAFRVRHLLALQPGQVLATQWSYGEDVPLAAGDVQLAWSEFEIIENQLGVRITRLP